MIFVFLLTFLNTSELSIEKSFFINKEHLSYDLSEIAVFSNSVFFRSRDRKELLYQGLDGNSINVISLYKAADDGIITSLKTIEAGIGFLELSKEKTIYWVWNPEQKQMFSWDINGIFLTSFSDLNGDIIGYSPASTYLADSGVHQATNFVLYNKNSRNFAHIFTNQFSSAATALQDASIPPSRKILENIDNGVLVFDQYTGVITVTDRGMKQPIFQYSVNPSPQDYSNSSKSRIVNDVLFANNQVWISVGGANPLLRVVDFSTYEEENLSLKTEIYSMALYNQYLVVSNYAGIHLYK